MNIDIENEKHCLSLWSHIIGFHNKKAKAIIKKFGLKKATKKLLDKKISGFSISKLDLQSKTNASSNLLSHTSPLSHFGTPSHTCTPSHTSHSHTSHSHTSHSHTGLSVTSNPKIFYSKHKKINPIEALNNFYSDGGILIGPDNKLWPKNLSLLQNTEYAFDEPICLWVNSKNPTFLSSDANKFISIVGSRNISEYGNEVCKEFTNNLSKKGYIIVSGGAMGIDITAHKCALQNNGKTISIMASGADSFFPKNNWQILKTVSEKGAVISESPPNSPAFKERFLTRNRIIAALSVGTIIIEAGYRSGAINTASHSASYLRTVGAVPGNVLTPYSAGCHRIIYENIASLITDSDDFLSLINPKLNLFSLTEKQNKIFNLLKPISESALEELCDLSGKSPLDVSAILSSLEQIGKIARKNNGWVKCNNS